MRGRQWLRQPPVVQRARCADSDRLAGVRCAIVGNFLSLSEPWFSEASPLQDLQL